MITRNGTEARFAAVLEPVAQGERPGVDSVSVDTADGKIRVLVRRGEAIDTVTLVDRRAVLIAVGGKTVLTSPESLAP